jgi:hypothetical protein
LKQFIKTSTFIVIIETERQRDRETERQRDRETERQRDRETGRQRDRQRDIDTFIVTFHFHWGLEIFDVSSNKQTFL